MGNGLGRGLLREEDHTGFGEPGLHVWDGRALGLFELHLGTQEQGAQTQVGQRQHHVEILPHVTVVQKMMAVEPEEDAGTLHVAPPGQVHAPVQVFVGAVTGELKMDRILTLVSSRYPEAEALPLRPELDPLLARFGLKWHPGNEVYARLGDTGYTLHTGNQTRLPTAFGTGVQLAARDQPRRRQHARFRR